MLSFSFILVINECAGGEQADTWPYDISSTVTKIKENSDQNHCKNCHKMALLEAVEER